MNPNDRLIVCGGLWAANAAEIVILTFLLPILKDEWNLSQGINGIVGLSVFMGTLFGSILWTNIGERYGRIPAIKLCIIGQIIFGILCAVIPNIVWMVIFRFFVGICLGGYVVNIYIYITYKLTQIFVSINRTSVAFKLYSECFSKSASNKYFLKQINFWVIGSITNTLIAWLTLQYLDWRWYLAISSSSLLILLTFTFCLLESPKWTLDHKDLDETQILLMKIAKLNGQRLLNGSLKSSNRLFTFGDEINDSSKWSIFYMNKFECKQIFASRYYSTSLTLYIICFCAVFGYYGLCIFSKRFFDANNGNRVYLKMFIISLAEIPCLFIARYGVKSSLMGCFIIFALSMFALMIPKEGSNAMLGVILMFIGRLSIFSASLIIYIYIYSQYSILLRDDAIELLYIIGRFGAILTVFVSQSQELDWSLYMYGLCGSVSFIASSMLKKLWKPHKISQLMAASYDYKSIERHAVEPIVERSVEKAVEMH